jgi:cbb3-type cytochrome oxidase subunit 3
VKLGERWSTLRPYFHRFDTVLAVLILLAVVWFVYDRWKNRVRAT